MLQRSFSAFTHWLWELDRQPMLQVMHAAQAEARRKPQRRRAISAPAREARAASGMDLARQRVRAISSAPSQL